jgi:two-component system, OmpR family, sensor histidine kinase ArlS
MQIRTKIAMQFSLIVAVILAIFSYSFYYFSENFRKREFANRLAERVVSTSQLMRDLGLTFREKKKIRDANKTMLAKLNAEKVLVFNNKDEVEYSSFEAETFKYSPDLLNKVRQRKFLDTTINELQVIGITFKDAKDTEEFVSIASASDVRGKENSENLRKTLIITFFIGIAMTIFLGVLFAGQSLKPISAINREIKNITAYNLQQKLSTGNNRDEVAQLAHNFNQMLVRLEKSFELQRSFVSNASHELRTPLAALKSELQITLESERTIPEYKSILQSLLNDTQRLIQLTNGLLQLAQSENRQKDIKMQAVRIDELLFEAQEEVMNQNADYQVFIDFDEIPEDDEWVTVNGNESLLKTVFTNLFDNACKYSTDHKAEVMIKFNQKNCIIEVKDNGIGIAQEEISKIFEPFYRTNNATTFKGHGIGLSICRRIIDMHKGRIEAKSELDKGSVFMVQLPHL